MSSIYPPSTSEIARKRRDLAPGQQAAFEAFSKAVFADGVLPAKIKQIIAVAVAHVTQCPYCINGHTKAALRTGATSEELMEAIWVATEMRATSTTAGDRIRALTGQHPIKPTSTRCHSAWQPSPGRRSTYRRGKSVQTTGATSVNIYSLHVENSWRIGQV